MIGLAWLKTSVIVHYPVLDLSVRTGSIVKTMFRVYDAMM